MQWNSDPTLLIPLAASVVVYLWGLGRAWRRAGAGHGITIQSAVLFLGAILALIVALVSPLEALSDILFSAHMVQHLILILVAAPLLATSDFPLALLSALPRRWAPAVARHFYHSPTWSRVWHIVTSPIMAWLLFTITLWVWHTSLLFQAALRDERIHAVEHLGFLLTAMLFWSVLFRHSVPKYVQYGTAVPYLFATCVQSTILGALLLFSSQPWYPYYAGLGTRWGLAPLADQQLAGLIMWVPGGFVFTLLTIGYFAAWFGQVEQRNARL